MFNDYEIRNKLRYIIINNINLNNIFIKTIADILREKKSFMILYNDVFDTIIILLT